MTLASKLLNTTVIGVSAVAGGYIGYGVDRIMDNQANPGSVVPAVADTFAQICSVPTLAGTASGAALGGFVVGTLWLGGYNPMQRVYNNLTSHRYRVLKEYPVSSGNFHVVHVADLLNGGAAVLKMPRLGEKFKNSEVNRMLVDEYQVLSKIDSPHVVRPLELIKGWRYRILALEHVAGLTLAKQQRVGPLNLPDTIEFALATAKGFKALHDKNHRFGHYIDFHLNIILHPERKAVLLDPDIYEMSHGPQDEMDTWARIVGSSFDKNAHPNPILQNILSRALGKDGLLMHESYDALITELEALIV